MFQVSARQGLALFKKTSFYINFNWNKFLQNNLTLQKRRPSRAKGKVMIEFCLPWKTRSPMDSSIPLVFCCYCRNNLLLVSNCFLSSKYSSSLPLYSLKEGKPNFIWSLTLKLYRILFDSTTRQVFDNWSHQSNINKRNLLLFKIPWILNYKHLPLETTKQNSILEKWI